MGDALWSSADRLRHWDSAYRTRGVAGVSWFEATPSVSLSMIEILGVPPDGAVIDIGGGASSLVDHLLKLGFGDVTVLDISATALETSRCRLPADAPVTWLNVDLLSWKPERHYDLWHDRAVFHFLVDHEVRTAYLAALRSAVAPDGAVILATFAPDGPESCSGLPVARYAADDIASVLGEDFEVIEARPEEHLTPTGATQPFTWIAARAKSH
jgi:SAM-dependent methyltransferase